MKWIGLTGGIATGKSTVAEILRDKGYTVIDADKIAQQVVAPKTLGLEKIRQNFGPDMILPDGSLDRKKMANEVFSDPNKLSQLEIIIHPLVKDETKKIKQDCISRGEKFVFYDVPLLFEKKMEQDFDQIVVVSSSLEFQKERMKKRNNWDEGEIQKRLSSQLNMKYKEEGADFVIHNLGNIDDLKLKVDKLLEALNKD